MQRLLGPHDPTSKRLNLRDLTQTIRYRLTGSKFEQSFTYYQNAKHHLPHRYTKTMRLRPPAVLKVTLKNAYPRCIVTRRISVDSTGAPSAGTYYGPFPSRKFALAFAERVLDFFKVRRCQIKIRRDPTFPGCLYSEMKMCLAPCFAGCSKEEYDAEVNRLVQFLDTDGNSLRAAIELEREKASDDLDFERAATIHKRIEKLDDALRGKPGPRPPHSGSKRRHPPALRRRSNHRRIRHPRRPLHRSVLHPLRRNRRPASLRRTNLPRLSRIKLNYKREPRADANATTATPAIATPLPPQPHRTRRTFVASGPLVLQ